MIVERLGGKPVVLYIPYGEGERFGGLIDILNQQIIIYGNDLGTDIQIKPLPEEVREQAEAVRAQTVEAICENDNTLLEKYLMEEPISNEELIPALRAATIAGLVQPVLCGSALKNKGVQVLLDAVIDYLPSPLDIPPVKGLDPDTGAEIERSPSDDEPLAALVFKIITDPFVGRLAFFRVYSGVIKAGTGVLNTATKPTLDVRVLPTAKPSPVLCAWTKRSSASLVVMVSMHAWSSSLSRCRKTRRKPSCSKTRFAAVLSRASSSSRPRTASVKPFRVAC